MRAYSLWGLAAHEIVDDRIGERDFGPTGGVLCQTGVVYVGELGEQTLSFTISGKLGRNGMVMQDRETGTLPIGDGAEAREGSGSRHPVRKERACALRPGRSGI